MNQQVKAVIVSPVKKTKVCPNCEKRKKVEQFHQNAARPDGLNVWCKTCMNAYSKAHYKANAEKRKRQTTAARQMRKDRGSTAERDYTRTYREEHQGQIRYELSTRRSDAVKRARHKGLPITITLDELEALWIKQEGCCDLTGWQMRVRGGGLKDPYCLTIDRVENAKGYVPGNVRLICWIVNKAFCDWGEDLFLEMCRTVVDRCG